MEKQTPTRSLTEQLLIERGTDLPTYISGLRAQGLGWRAVAQRLSDDHGVSLHWTLLHRWFRDDESSAA